MKIHNATDGSIIWIGNHDAEVLNMDISSDGKKIVTVSYDKVIKVWNLNNGQLLWERINSSIIRSVYFSPDGNKIGTGEDSAKVRMWDASNGNEIWSNSVKDIVKIQFSPDGKYIVSSQGQKSNIELWDVNTGNSVWKHNILIVGTALDYSPDGKRIVACGAYKAGILNAQNGNLIWLSNEIDEVRTVKFSPDSKTIVYGTVTDSIKVWSLKQNLLLTEPDSSREYRWGWPINISWTSLNVTKVNLEYSTDDGNNWITIENGINAYLENYNWTAPNVKSTKCKIRISDASDESIKNETEGTFTIYFPNIVITNPLNGDVFRGGTIQNITWESEHVSKVNILFSSNNGISWNKIAENIPASSGNYNWLVPCLTSSNCIITVADSSDSSVKDGDSTIFAIYNDIEIINPSAGSLWEVGSLQEIKWNNNIANKIGIEYSTNNGETWSTIISSISANIRSYFWRVPNTPSANCQIRIFNVDNINEYDTTDDSFTIFNRKLVLTSPNGGENLIACRKFNVMWSSEYVSKIRMEYSIDGGINWVVIIDSADAKINITEITIPNVLSDNCKIRITDIGKPELTDESNSTFSIYQANIIVIKPNGGERWITGTSQEIEWSSSYVSNIKIDYTIDNGVTWETIVNSVSTDTDKYYWIVKNTVSSMCLIRISDKDNPNVWDESDGQFSIETATSINRENENYIPTKFALYQCYPNPFNPTTTISFDVPYNTRVELKVYDLLGREINNLVSEEKATGKYEVKFDGSRLASGLYLYKLQAGSFVQTKKLLLLK